MSQTEDTLALFLDDEYAQLYLDTQILLLQNFVGLLGIGEGNRINAQSEITRYQNEGASIIQGIIESLEEAIAMEAEI